MKDAVRRIMSAMNLPSKTTDKGADAHYRCSALLAPTVGVKEKSATRFISIACEVVDSCRCSVY